MPSQLDTSKYPLWELDCVCFDKRFVVFFIGTVNYFEYDKENSQWIEITSFLTYLKKSKASDDFNNYRNSYIGLLLDQINSTSGYFKYCTYTLDNPIRVSRLWHSTNPVGDIIEVKIDSPNNIIEVYSLFKNLNIVSFRYVFNYENFRETKTEFTIPIDINKSGTRREELLMNQHEMQAVWAMRRALGNRENAEVTEAILDNLQMTKDNATFIDVIQKTRLK